MHPGSQIVTIMNKIYKDGLTTTSGGNISIMDDEGTIWITPAGVDKGSLQPSDIMCITKDGSITGKHKPSSEFPFHKAIFEIRPDIKAIIHAHPPALVSFSIVRETPNTNVFARAKQVCGPIGYAKYELPGSKALGSLIADEFAKGYKAIIMENHGTVVGGEDITEALQRFETLEFTARTIIYGNTIGKPEYLTDQQVHEFESQIPAALPEMENVAYPPDELQKRNEICNIVHRACRQGLMISAYGTVSTRWRGNDFLITPTDVARWNLVADDIVQIKDGKREPGKYPCRATWLHREIYKRMPSVNSIISTQPSYLMAFATTKKLFDVRTIPESWIFLQDVPSLPFGSQYHDKADILDSLISGNTAVIIQNDSVLFTGNELLQTYDYVEVAELSAKSLVMSASIGKLHPINDRQISDLKRVFIDKK